MAKRKPQWLIRSYFPVSAGDRRWRVDGSVPGTTAQSSTRLYLSTRKDAQRAADAIADAVQTFARDNGLDGLPRWPLQRREYVAQGRYGYTGVDEFVTPEVAKQAGLTYVGMARTTMTGLTRKQGAALIDAISGAIDDFLGDNGLGEQGPRTGRRPTEAARIARKLQRRGMDELALYGGRSRLGPIEGVTPVARPRAPRSF